VSSRVGQASGRLRDGQAGVVPLDPTGGVRARASADWSALSCTSGGTGTRIPRPRPRHLEPVATDHRPSPRRHRPPDPPQLRPPHQPDHPWRGRDLSVNAHRLLPALSSTARGARGSRRPFVLPGRRVGQAGGTSCDHRRGGFRKRPSRCGRSAGLSHFAGRDAIPDQIEHFPGGVAFEAADDLAPGFALRDAPLVVVAGTRIEPEP